MAISRKYAAYLRAKTEHIYATPAQELYIKRLRQQCAAKGVRAEYGPTTKYRQLRDSASAEIDMLKRRLAAAQEAA